MCIYPKVKIVNVADNQVSHIYTCRYLNVYPTLPHAALPVCLDSASTTTPCFSQLLSHINCECCGAQLCHLRRNTSCCSYEQQPGRIIPDGMVPAPVAPLGNLLTVEPFSTRFVALCRFFFFLLPSVRRRCTSPPCICA